MTNRPIVVALAVLAVALVVLATVPADETDAAEDATPEITDSTAVVAGGACGSATGSASWSYNYDPQTDTCILTITNGGSVSMTTSWTIATLKVADKTVTGNDLGKYSFTTKSGSYSIDKTFKNLELKLSADVSANTVLRGLNPVVVSDGAGCKTVPDSLFSGCMSIKTVDLSNAASIGKSAFENCKGLTRLTLKNTVTIGEAAFKATILPTAELPSSLRTLGKEAFASTTTLTTVVLPSGVTSFGDSAFQGCTRLATLTLAGSTVGNSCFKGCTSLATVSVPASMRAIGSEAFSGCTSLKALTFASGTTSIGASAFQGCRTLPSVELPSTLTSLGASAFSGCTAMTSAKFSSAVAVGSSAFSGCTALKTVDMGARAVSIGATAFQGCTAMASFDVTTANVEYTSFQGCTALASLSATGSSVYKADGGILYTSNQSTLYMAPPAMKKEFGIGDLPSAVRTINLDYATNSYYIDDGTVSYDISFVPTVPSTGSIGVRYSSLGMSEHSLSRTGDVVTLSYRLYSGWTYSEDGVYAASASVRSGAGTLEITLSGAFCTVYPMGVRTLTYEQLDKAEDISGWPSEWTLVLQRETYAEQGKTGTVKEVGVQEYRATAYRGTSSSATLEGRFQLHGITFGIDSIELGHDGYGALTDLTLGEGVGIQASAFADSQHLVSITADHVAEVGRSAFRNCTSLVSASFASCARFDDYALDNCSSLTALHLGAASVSFGEGALWGCSSLRVLVAGSATVVTGADGIPTAHLDASVTGCTFTASENCLLVSCTAEASLLVSQTADRTAAVSYSFYSGVAVVPLSGAFYVWLADGKQESGYQVVFDNGIAGGYEFQIVQAGSKAEEVLPHGMSDYSFLYWAHDGERFDFDTAISGTTVLTAVYQQKAAADPEQTTYIAIIAVALAAAAVLPLVFRRLG